MGFWTKGHTWEEAAKLKLSNFERMMLIEEQTANEYRKRISDHLYNLTLELRAIRQELQRPRR